MLGAGPLVARRVNRVEADQGSRQLDRVEGIGPYCHSLGFKMRKTGRAQKYV